MKKALWLTSLCMLFCCCVMAQADGNFKRLFSDTTNSKDFRFRSLPGYSILKALTAITAGDENLATPPGTTDQRPTVPEGKYILRYNTDLGALEIGNDAQEWTLVGQSADSTTASNGLYMSGNNVRLGGTLTEATTINGKHSSSISLLFDSIYTFGARTPEFRLYMPNTGTLVLGSREGDPSLRVDGDVWLYNGSTYQRVTSTEITLNASAGVYLTGSGVTSVFDTAAYKPLGMSSTGRLRPMPYWLGSGGGGSGSVTAVGLSMPPAFTVTGSPVTDADTLTVTMTGTTSQYLRGDGSLATFDTASIPTFYAKVRAVLSATSPLSYNSGTGAFSIQQATSGQPGYLGQADFVTFSNKLGDPGGNGLLARTAIGVTQNRSIVTPNSNNITILNGSGVSGNPSIDIGTNVATLSGTQIFAGQKNFDNKIYYTAAPTFTPGADDNALVTLGYLLSIPPDTVQVRSPNLEVYYASGPGQKDTIALNDSVTLTALTITPKTVGADTDSAWYRDPATGNFLYGKIVGTGGGEGGDFSSNTATSADGEVVLFSGTSGKLGKRATGSGVAKLSSGVLSTGNVNLTSEVTGTLPVANGGTGNASYTSYGLIAAGTTSTGAFQQVSGTGTAGQVLTSNGAGALPTWQDATGGGGGSGVTTVGSFSGSSIANGASIASTTITFGPADGTNPGMVSTGTQTIAGAKTLTSVLTLPNGTSSAPSFGFASQSNTGIYRAASNTLGVAANGSMAATFETRTLTLGAWSSGQSNTITAGSAAGGSNRNGLGLIIQGGASTGTGTGGEITFWTTPASGSSGSSVNTHVERMRITNGGNVGIGTNSPFTYLHVKNPTAGNYNPQIIAEDAQSDGYAHVSLRGSGRIWGVLAGNSSESVFGVANAFAIFDGTDGAVRFRILPSGEVRIPHLAGTGTRVLRADADGDLTPLANGTNGQVLKMVSGSPAWSTDETGGGGVADGDKGDVTVASSGVSWTIDADAVTFAKMQDISTARLLGRTTASTGDIEQITVSSDLSLASGTLGIGSSVATLTGSQTLTNKTLTTPTIGSFTNATHNHTNAAGGGQLTDAALSAAVGIAKGGTAKTSFTAYTLVAGGTTSTGALQQVSGTGTSGQVLTSNGAGALPTWQDAAGGGGGGDFSSNTASSVDGEIVLFSGTGGKTGKRATQTGILLGTSGVLSAVTTSSGIAGALSDETGSGALVFGTSPTFTTAISVNGVINVNSYRFAYYPSGVSDAGTTLGIGEGALGSHTTGQRNVAIGFNALNAITTGFDNVAIGSRALDVLGTSANTNVAIGKDAGGALTSGNGNVFIGSSAANSQTSGSSNISIGSSATLPSTTGSNQLNIGNSLYSNTLGDANFLLGFGGMSSSFPALRRSGTDLEVKLADNSGYTNINVASETYGPSWSGNPGAARKGDLYTKLQTLPTTYEAKEGELSTSTSAGGSSQTVLIALPDGERGEVEITIIGVGGSSTSSYHDHRFIAFVNPVGSDPNISSGTFVMNGGEPLRLNAMDTDAGATFAVIMSSDNMRITFSASDDETVYWKVFYKIRSYSPPL